MQHDDLKKFRDSFVMVAKRLAKSQAKDQGAHNVQRAYIYSFRRPVAFFWAQGGSVSWLRKISDFQEAPCHPL